MGLRVARVLRTLIAIIVALVAWNVAFRNGAPASAPIDTFDPSRIVPDFSLWLEGSLPRHVTEAGVAELLVVLAGYAVGDAIGRFVRGVFTGVLMLVFLFVLSIGIDYGLQVARNQATSDPESALNTPTFKTVLDTLLLADSFIRGTTLPPGPPLPLGDGVRQPDTDSNHI